MRNIRMLGLLAVSATALTAFVGTSSASASTFTFGGAGVRLTTETTENHAFTVEGSKVECEEVSFEGESTGAASETQTFTPATKKCKAFGFATATVTTGSCRYTFKAATTGEHATVSLGNCADATKGIQIEVNVPFIAKCVVDTPHQTITGAAHYHNKTPTGTTMAVELTFTKTGVMNDVTVSTGACPLKVGTNSTGAYTGKSTVTASDGNVTWSA